MDASIHPVRSDDMAAQPWEQRGNESAKAFAALRTYLDLGTGRSLDALANARASGGTQEGTRKAPGNLRRWSARHGWTERAAAWDAHLDALRTRGAEQEAIKQGRRWQQRRDKVNERTFNCAFRLIDQAGRLLSLPLVKTTTIDDGITFTIEPLPIDDLKAGASLLMRGDSVARIAIADGLQVEDARRRVGVMPDEAMDARDEAAKHLEEWRAEQRAKILNRPGEPPANGTDNIDASPSGAGAS